MKLGNLFIFLLIYFFMSSNLINAQWSDDPANPKEVNILTDSYGIQTISDCQGGIIICNSVYNKSNNKFNAFLQRLDTNGFEAWKEGGVQLADSGNMAIDYRKKIISDSNGGAYIVWGDYRRSGWSSNRYAVYLQHVDSQGNSTLSDGGIAITDFILNLSFDIISDNNNGVIVLWNQPSKGVYGQRINNLGNRLWGFNGEKLCDKEGSFATKLTYKNTFLFVNNDTLHNISIDGNELWKIKINGFSDYYMWEFNKEFYVSWRTYNHDFYLQKFDANGNKLFGNNGKNVGRPFVYSDFRIDSNGNIYILHSHSGDQEPPRFLQKFDKDGNPLWQNELSVSTTAHSSEAFTLDISGEPIIIWQPGSYNDPQKVIYYQKYDSQGNPQNPFKAIISNNSHIDDINGKVEIERTINNGLIYCWYGFTEKNKVFATKINGNGTLEGKGFVYSAPTLVLNNTSILSSKNILISGSGFTKNSAVNLGFAGPSGFSIPTVTITADANGQINYTFTATTNLQLGYYYVAATDITTNKTTATKMFQIVGEEEKYSLKLNSPKSNSQYYSGDNLNVTWSDQMTLGNNYPIDGAKRKYSYKIELSTDGGSNWKEVTTVIGKEEINKVAMFSKDITVTTVGENNKVRVTDLFNTSRYIVSESFSVKPAQSASVKVSFVWDYSYPERNGEPKGVACDGVARIYLKVYKNSPLADNIKEVTVSLSDNVKNTEARILGKLKVATIIDSYNEEAGDANSISVTSTNVANDGAFWFWYVAPDDFCGKNIQDSTSIDRTVNTNIKISYSSGKVENTSAVIKIVRPPLLLAHGLGGGSWSWNQFSYFGNEGYKKYLNDERFLVRKALDLDWRGKFWINAAKLLFKNDPNSFYRNIQEMRNKYFACNQVIYIGHSMGGCVVREAIKRGINKNENYNKGYLNKIITLDTPHLGSPYADLIYSLIEKIKSSKWLSLPLVKFLDYDSHSLPNSLCIASYDGNSFISATGACEDLRTSGGEKLDNSSLSFHLISGDIVPGDQNLPEIPQAVYQMFNYTDDFFEFFDKIIDITNVMGTLETQQLIKQLSPLNKVERVIKFCEYIIKAYEGVSFIVDSDLIVSVKSQLSTLPRNSNNVSVFPRIEHSAVVRDFEVGNKVNTLMNSSKEKYFGSISASLSKSVANSHSILNSSSSTALKKANSNGLIISSPTLDNVVSVDSVFNVGFSISDTTDLSYVKIYFQNEVYSSNKVSNKYNFTIQANGNMIDTQKVEVVASFMKKDSSYFLYDFRNIIVTTNSQPKNFISSEKTVNLMKNQTYNPSYTAVFPTFISNVSSKSPYLSITINDLQILQYDNQNKIFKGLAEGETSAVVNYRGAADTIYFVIDKTDYITTGVEDNSSNNRAVIPTMYSLSQNYPNPFNPTTKIKFSIPNISKVTLKIFDILGREVERLVDEEKNPGVYEVQFNASRLASGIYFYRLQAGEFSQTKKLVLLK